MRFVLYVCVGIRGDHNEAHGPGPRRQAVAAGLQTVGAKKPVAAGSVRINISHQVGRVFVHDHVHAARHHHALQVVSEDHRQTGLVQQTRVSLIHLSVTITV